MNILDQDIGTIVRFIQVVPLEVVRQLKIECDKNPNNEKVKQIMPELTKRLG